VCFLVVVVYLKSFDLAVLKPFKKAAQAENNNIYAESLAFFPREDANHGLSWCDQNETGLCGQKENNALPPLPDCNQSISSLAASAEDRALRGRNLSAV
jgi:hypothetical protein